MTFEEPLFLLDICVELSNEFATQEYEITANSENLFGVSLINLTKNNNKLHTKDKKTIKRQIKKKISIRCIRDFDKYGKSLLLAKTAAELISIMKMHKMQLDIKNKANVDDGIGTVFISWAKSIIQYLKNIEEQPKLPPAVQKEKFNVVNEKNNISVGSLVVNIKLVSLASDFYKFISSSRANVRIYRDLFSNPKLLRQQSNIVLSGNYKHARNTHETKYTCNNEFDITYNIIDSTENSPSRRIVKTCIENNDEKNISATNSCIYKTRKSGHDLASLEGEGWEQANKYPNKFSGTTYCINYFTSNKNVSSNESPMKTITFKNDGKTSPKALPVANFKSSHSTYSKPDSPIVEVTRCHNLACNANIRRSKLPMYDGSLALDLTNVNHQRCEGSTSLKFDQHPCYCTCECKFQFIRETTYCEICGGYEVIGEEFADTRGQEMPMPCPIFHKLAGKYKLRTRSSSGSIRRRKGDGSSKSTKSSRSTRSSTSKTSEKRPNVPVKKVIQPKPTEKLQKKKLIKLKKMDYSYKTPHIGHGDCVHPCVRSAILKCNVPKSMGWFWTADDVDGLEYRPTWRPGAADNHLVQMLAAARHHKQIIMKKRKKEVSKFKRPLKRPLLVVHKKDGEFTITMETMKTSAKPREVFEQPYEDKPLLTYTVGRTDEENKVREKQKLKKQRRLEREQRAYVEGAFKNVCQEICLKTCRQALGILPEAEDKQGLCYENATWVEPVTSNPSCACSDNSLTVSDTDSDEWLIEFTPPNAFFDPSRKGKKIVKIERDTQYMPPEC